MVTDIQSTEAGKEVLKQAKQAVESLEKAAEAVGNTQAYKHVASTAKVITDELDSLADVRMYSRPGKLFIQALLRLDLRSAQNAFRCFFHKCVCIKNG